MAFQSVQDGSVDFSGGQNAALLPDKVPTNAYYAAVNISTEDGSLSPQFGVEELVLKFPTNKEFTLTNGTKRSYESIFTFGKFQALIPYSIGNEFFFIVVISGVIYLVNQNTLDVQIIEISDGSKINELLTRVNWSNAGRFLVLFDFPSYPVIIEGLVARRADPTNNEIPRSVFGTYNQNRLVIANSGNEFTAGDPAAVGFPDGPITFNEILQPASPYFGQVFQLSTNYNNDPITAMTFLQVIDKSTGIGPLIVSTQTAVYSYHTEIARNQWEASQFGSVFIHDAGIAGPRAHCNVNSDLFFISTDGQVRSASMSRDEQNKWSRTPISREVQNWIGIPDKSLLYFSVMTYFQNRIFATVNPFRTTAQTTDYKTTFDYAFGGFCILETSNVSTLGKTAQPAWAGLRTSIRPMDIIQNNQRCFAISKEGGINKLYEIRKDLTYDIVGKEKTSRPLKCKIYTREYGFNSPFQLKILNSIMMALSGIKGKFKLRLSYKPTQGSSYIFWQEFTHEAPWRSCTSIDSCGFKGFESHSFRQLVLGSPVDQGCSEVTKENYDTFTKVSLLFEIEGIDWSLEEFLINASMVPQNTTESICEPYPIVAVCSECNTDWEIPSICQETIQA